VKRPRRRCDDRRTVRLSTGILRRGPYDPDRHKERAGATHLNGGYRREAAGEVHPANARASRLFVLTRSPGRRGIIDSPITVQSCPSAMTRRWRP
jgi:hypothetical protein